ncbi:hypothetical protein NONI108955_21115 [Nocardia ninae]|uniref:KOW domain-containing protein n=1 Tax=Nocardia ninae NBRC 108245 TaxID=1210091 RepID=A0A511M9W6_9NOCA|nr:MULTISPECIES: hypothetical protein [Nocardia]GEM37455.1 hypothetical protein NN4_19740 [Nocardia ninae NBRC 108245]
MKAQHLTVEHRDKILVTGEGSKRKRGTIRDLDFTASSYVLATVDYPAKGLLKVALPLDADIEIEN